MFQSCNSLLIVSSTSQLCLESILHLQADNFINLTNFNSSKVYIRTKYSIDYIILTDVCIDIATEPILESLSGKTFRYKSANTSDEARSALSARGFCLRV